GASVEGAARQTGASERHICRRLADPKFCRRLDSLQTEMMQRSAAMLTAGGVDSVKTLLELQKAPTPPAVRLGAARTVLEMRIRMRELLDVERRLGAVEQKAAAGGGGRGGGGAAVSVPGPGRGVGRLGGGVPGRGGRGAEGR